MDVKKSTLRRWTIIAGIIIIASAIIIPILHSQYKEKQRIEEFSAAVERIIDREYKSLLRDYKFEAKQVLDSDYSIRTRRRSVIKINEMLGSRFFGAEDFVFYSEYRLVDEFRQTHQDRDGEIKALLKQMAAKKAFDSLVE